MSSTSRPTGPQGATAQPDSHGWSKKRSVEGRLEQGSWEGRLDTEVNRHTNERKAGLKQGCSDRLGSSKDFEGVCDCGKGSALLPMKLPCISPRAILAHQSVLTYKAGRVREVVVQRRCSHPVMPIGGGPGAIAAACLVAAVQRCRAAILLC